MKYIVLLVTLDTKGEEAAYLRELILSHGRQPFIIDIGCGGLPQLEADISAAEVAQAANADIEALRGLDSSERERATETMIAGAVIKLRGLYEAGQLEGLISIGGVSSAVMASTIMKEVSYKVPKLLLTSGATLPGAYRFFGPTGVTVMHCLVEVGGLNRLLKGQLARAAGAICGMVEGAAQQAGTKGLKPAVAMTTNGWVETCGHHILKVLESEYEIIRFHATGLPEVIMEKLVDDNYFSGVIDLVPSSITNEKFHGSRISWPRRLEVAGERGIPQVVATSLVDVISRIRDTSPEQIAEMKERKYYFMDALRILLWLDAEELRSIAAIYAERLNKAVGPTKLLIPMRGWLSLEHEGSEFYDPASLRGFVRALKPMLKPAIDVREIDANIDTVAFGQAVIDAFQEVMRA